MSILEYAEMVLKVPLTHYQRELLTLMDKNKNSTIYFTKPRSHGLIVAHEVYKKYCEVITA